MSVIHRNLAVSLSSKETAKEKKKQEKKARDDESVRLARENIARHKAAKAERIRVQGEVAANLMAEKARLVLEAQHLAQLQVEANMARLAESASTSRPPSREAAVQEKLALDPANGQREQWIMSRTNGELRRVDLINKRRGLLIEVKTYKNRHGVFEQITNYHKILSEKGVTIRTLRIHFFDVLTPSAKSRLGLQGLCRSFHEGTLYSLGKGER